MGMSSKKTTLFYFWYTAIWNIQIFALAGSANACEKTSFIFLRQEIPVRLANIMKEIDLLPDKLIGTPSVQLLHTW